MRRAVQQEQGGALNHAPRRGGNPDTPRDPLPADWMALEPEIRPLPRCIQAFDYVSFRYRSVYGNPHLTLVLQKP